MYCKIKIEEERLKTLFQVHREKTPSLLEEAFSFSLWDARSQSYFCARDALGICSFYYAFDEGDFFCAGSLSALLAQLPFKPKPNISSMSALLQQKVPSMEETMYEGVYRLPPGHYMYVKGKKTTPQRYWHPAEIKTDYSLSFEEAKKKFVHLFQKAVLSSIPPNETVACELSGGFDSSSVLCVAEKNNMSLLPLSMDLSDKSCDERFYRESVLTHLQKEGIAFNCQNLDYKTQYNMQYNYDLTPHWPIWVTFTMKAPLLQYLRDQGICTVLTGQMGDHILWQNDRVIVAYLQRFEWRRFYQECSFLCKKRGISKGRWFYKNIIKVWLGKHLTRTQINRLKQILEKKITLDESFPIDESEYINTEAFSSEAQKEMVYTLTSLHHSMYVDSNFSKAAQEKYGIAFKHPFANKALVEFMLSLPPEYKYSLGNPRHFHGEALQAFLPQALLQRRDKAEFSVLVLQQIEAIDRVSLWKNPSIVKLGLVKAEEIEALEVRFEENTLKGYGLQRYWRMINVEYWYNLNTYMDKGVCDESED